MKRLAALFLCVTFLSSCAPTPRSEFYMARVYGYDPAQNTKAFAATGGVAGATIGAIVDKSTVGTLVGLTLGSVAGAIAGYQLDKEAERRRHEHLETVQRNPLRPWTRSSSEDPNYRF